MGMGQTCAGFESTTDQNGLIMNVRPFRVVGFVAFVAIFGWGCSTPKPSLPSQKEPLGGDAATTDKTPEQTGAINQESFKLPAGKTSSTALDSGQPSPNPQPTSEKTVKRRQKAAANKIAPREKATPPADLLPAPRTTSGGVVNRDYEAPTGELKAVTNLQPAPRATPGGVFYREYKEPVQADDPGAANRHPDDLPPPLRKTTGGVISTESP